MKRLPKLKKILLSGAVAFFLVLICCSVFAQVSYTWIWEPTVTFGLTTFGTTVGFDENIYLGAFAFNDGNSLTFYNLKFTGEKNVAQLIISSQATNVTVTGVTDAYCSYNVEGVGIQTINLDSEEPQSVTIDGTQRIYGDGWTFSSGTTTITDATTSAVLFFSLPPTGSGGYEFDNPLFTYLLEFNLFGFVVATYNTILGPLTFGIPMLFISAVLYIRQRNMTIISIIWIMVGSSIGSAMLELSALAVVFTVIGIGSLFAQLILSWRKQV